MITILVNNLNQMVVTTSEPIMQHSKNAHIVRIFVPNTYYTYDMTKFSASMELVPPNQKYRNLFLEPEEVSSKEGFIQYDLDITAEYTLFPGDIEMQMTFVYTDELNKSYVRHTGSCSLPVTAIERWAELITDDALSALDQKLVLIEQGIATTSALVDAVNMNKADNLDFNDDGDLQLKSNGNFIGDGVHVAVPSIEDDEDSRQDGILNLSEMYQEI